HPKEGEGPGDRDARDQWGVLEEDATVEPGTGAIGKIRVLAHWKDVVESLGDQASLSIYSLGESDEEGNVTALLAHETNSVDMVGYPGRPGSGLKKKIEAARAASPKPAAEPSAEEKKENHMEIKDLAERFDALIAKLEPVVAFVTAESAKKDESAKSEATAEDLDAARAEGAKAASESFAAIDAAELPEKIAEGLKAKVLEGKDVTDAIADAKAVAEAVAESAAEAGASSGYV